MRRIAVSTYCRPAGDSSALASASRPASVNNPPIFGAPWWNSCACTRCCHPRRSSINAQYSRPSVRISTTCGDGIHESGNRPSHNNVRNSRASARSVLARFFGPRNPAVSAGSARCATTPAAVNSSTTNRHPVQPSTAISPPPSGQCSPNQRRSTSRVAGRI